MFDISVLDLPFMPLKQTILAGGQWSLQRAERTAGEVLKHVADFIIHDIQMYSKWLIVVL